MAALAAGSTARSAPQPLATNAVAAASATSELTPIFLTSEDGRPESTDPGGATTSQTAGGVPPTSSVTFVDATITASTTALSNSATPSWADRGIYAYDSFPA